MCTFYCNRDVCYSDVGWSVLERGQNSN